MDDAFARIDRLTQVGLRLARSAPSGQVLLARLAIAVDPALVPRPWGDAIMPELQAAREAACRPLEMRRVERILRDAWGSRPSDELDELESEPVAVTPTSQVHRGRLDGAPVAVKVLRPGLAASVRQDLALLDSLMRPLDAAFPALDAPAMLAEVRERTLEELDLEHEAGVQRAFHRRLRNHPFLSAPAPVMRLAHDEVLVSEWVEGDPLDRCADPDTAAARLVVFVLGSAREGTIHCDPDPANVLVQDDGRLSILDYGLTRTVERPRLEAVAAALEAFTAEDVDAFGPALERLGWLPPARGAQALDLAREALGELGGAEPSRLDVDAVREAGRRLLTRPEELAELIVAGAPTPEDLWPALAAGQLFAVIARVGASGPWRELTRRALREGWSATP